MEFNLNAVMKREMQKYTENVLKEAVTALSAEYGFKAEEALAKMMNQDKKQEKKEKTVEVEGPKVPLPFTGDIKGEWCMAMKQNHGLYSQCTSAKKDKGELCKTCQHQEDTKGKPSFGYIADRLKCDLMEYVDDKGKKVQSYGMVLKKLKIEREFAEGEAKKFGIAIPETQFAVAEKMRGRPKTDKEESSDSEAEKKRGRPKKEKKMVSANAADDLIASLVAQAQQIKPNAEAKQAQADAEAKQAQADAEAKQAQADAEAKQAQADAEAKQAQADAEAKQAQEEVQADAEATSCDCGDSECDSSEEEEEKEQPKTVVLSKEEEKEQAKAAKKAQKEQEKLAKKAQQEQEKAAKKAEKEQEKAAKKAEKEQTKKTAAPEKKATPTKKAEPEPTPELEHEEESSNEATPSEEESINVKKFEFEGKTYLRSDDDVLFDLATQEPVGMWNEEENCIDEIEIDEE